MSDLSQDDRWYGARFAESIGDTLHLVAGRILRDLTEDRDKGVVFQVNTAFVLAVVGNTITVNVFLPPTQAEIDKPTSDRVRNRVQIVAARYDWRGKENDADRRFYLRINVKSIKLNLNRLTFGALLG